MLSEETVIKPSLHESFIFHLSLAAQLQYICDDIGSLQLSLCLITQRFQQLSLDKEGMLHLHLHSYPSDKSWRIEI